MRLNVGSGQHPARDPDWIDCDLPWFGVEDATVYADGFHLPFRSHSLDGAHCGHTAEHLEFDTVRPFFAELARCLRPGAVITIVGPDIEKAEATGQPEWLLRAIDTVSHEGPGGHKWVSTEARTIEALGGVLGPLESITAAEVGPPNPSGAPWQFALRGRAPS